eukprot:TRINITY_DN9869_c0_g1_i1.p2 TRINITY_DN9869_c0_g1~~TRINITY_DN9869_c0_g1_i1.p2  ORF type:complete len:284 (+),score=58.64 TRINITY_DN9869_c0_g1_i1:1118-1969(+)
MKNFVGQIYLNRKIIMVLRERYRDEVQKEQEQMNRMKRDYLRRNNLIEKGLNCNLDSPVCLHRIEIFRRFAKANSYLVFQSMEHPQIMNDYFSTNQKKTTRTSAPFSEQNILIFRDEHIECKKQQEETTTQLNSIHSEGAILSNHKNSEEEEYKGTDTNTLQQYMSSSLIGVSAIRDSLKKQLPVNKGVSRQSSDGEQKRKLSGSSNSHKEESPKWVFSSDAESSESENESLKMNMMEVKDFGVKSSFVYYTIQGPEGQDPRITRLLNSKTYNFAKELANQYA